MRFLLTCLLAVFFAAAVRAEAAREILTANSVLVEKASRQTIAPVIDALGANGDSAAAAILAAWAEKGLGIQKYDQAFFDQPGWRWRYLARFGWAGRQASHEIRYHRAK